MHWSAEGPDPAVLVAVGWGKKKTMNALMPGTEITITIQPARNGKPVAEMSNIVLPNGDLIWRPLRSPHWKLRRRVEVRRNLRQLSPRPYPGNASAGSV